MDFFFSVSLYSILRLTKCCLKEQYAEYDGKLRVFFFLCGFFFPIINVLGKLMGFATTGLPNEADVNMT